jgi:anaerobic carbon-monoxide dehydrogenase iron sulfur subunit
MRQVVVHPERCVGCMQCMLACAVAHSKSKDLFGSTLEQPRPRPRVHVGVGPANAGFPNRCRHCNPAPCQAGCLPGAIFRDAERETVLIDPDKCINCASCAMACPFGVIRYHPEYTAPPNKTVAVKCDNCDERQARGLVPACVEVCKVGALTFEEPDAALKRKTDEVSRSVLDARELPAASEGFALLRAAKKAHADLSRPRIAGRGARS